MFALAKTSVDITVQYSKLLFKIFIIIFALTYALVMFNFIDPSYFSFDLNVNSEAVFMTLLVSVGVYFLLRKPKR